MINVNLSIRKITTGSGIEVRAGETVVSEYEYVTGTAYAILFDYNDGTLAITATTTNNGVLSNDRPNKILTHQIPASPAESYDITFTHNNSSGTVTFPLKKKIFGDED